MWSFKKGPSLPWIFASEIALAKDSISKPKGWYCFQLINSPTLLPYKQNCISQTFNDVLCIFTRFPNVFIPQKSSKTLTIKPIFEDPHQQENPTQSLAINSSLPAISTTKSISKCRKLWPSSLPQCHGRRAAYLKSVTHLRRGSFRKFLFKETRKKINHAKQKKK